MAFWLVLRGFPGGALNLRLATFIYALTTVAGALSFLPGGAWACRKAVWWRCSSAWARLDDATAFAATFVTRLCTLWFAVAVGLNALGLLARRGFKVDLAAAADTVDPMARDG